MNGQSTLETNGTNSWVDDSLWCWKRVTKCKTIQLSRRLDQLMNTYYRQTAFDEEKDQDE